MISDYFPACAEIWLAACALLVVVGGAFSRPSQWKGWTVVSILAVLGGLFLVTHHYTTPMTAFGNMFVLDNLALGFKYLIGFGSVIALLMSIPFFAKRNEGKFEYPLIVLLATTGMFGMVSSLDFLSLYVSIELQSLSLYVLASFRRDVRLNSEAGLKYFFLGALSSGLLLYGISLFYGFVGSTSYIAIANTLAQAHSIAPPVIVALVLVIAGLGFKLAAAPFHMWTPDVYQGAPTPVTALFAIAPKAAIIGVFCRLITGPFAPIFDQAQQILIILSVLSMAVGAFAAIAQKNLKRLMAYSSIGHVGFIILGLVAGNNAGIEAVILYTALYIIMSVGAFAFILSVYDNAEGDEQIAYLSGLAKRQPVLALSFTAILLSMAGIPPLVGFFAKLVVFKAILQSGLTWLAVTGVIFSVVAAYYYLRIIKIMYFDAAPDTVPELHTNKIWNTLVVISGIAMVALLVFPQPLASFAAWAVGGR
jgi:NADH-quinone oxidoreductase subunit N